MTTITMTVKEIRKSLHITKKYAVIGEEEMTNQEADTALFEREQNDVLNVVDNGSHFLIWSSNRNNF